MLKKILFGSLIFAYLSILGLILIKFYWNWFVVNHLGFRDISFAEAWALWIFMGIFRWDDPKVDNLPLVVLKRIILTDEQMHHYERQISHELQNIYFRSPIRYTFRVFLILAIGYVVSHFFL